MIFSSSGSDADSIFLPNSSNFVSSSGAQKFHSIFGALQKWFGFGCEKIFCEKIQHRKAHTVKLTMDFCWWILAYREVTKFAQKKIRLEFFLEKFDFDESPSWEEWCISMTHLNEWAKSNREEKYAGRIQIILQCLISFYFDIIANKLFK